MCNAPPGTAIPLSVPGRVGCRFLVWRHSGASYTIRSQARCYLGLEPGAGPRSGLSRPLYCRMCTALQLTQPCPPARLAGLRTPPRHSTGLMWTGSPPPELIALQHPYSARPTRNLVAGPLSQRTHQTHVALPLQLPLQWWLLALPRPSRPLLPTQPQSLRVVTLVMKRAECRGLPAPCTDAQRHRK